MQINRLSFPKSSQAEHLTRALTTIMSSLHLKELSSCFKVDTLSSNRVRFLFKQKLSRVEFKWYFNRFSLGTSYETYICPNLFVERTGSHSCPNYLIYKPYTFPCISEQLLQHCVLWGLNTIVARPECTCNVAVVCLASVRIPLKYGLRLVGIPFCAAGQGLPPVDPAGFPSPYPPQRLGWGGEIPLHDSSPIVLPKDACDFALRRMARLRCFKRCCGNGPTTEDM